MTRRARIRRAAIGLGALIGFVFCLLYNAFQIERCEREEEWRRKLPANPRSMVEVSSARRGMICFRREGTPIFLPQSMWDNSACAAAIVQAVNFLLGRDEFLRTADAWEFSYVNRTRLRQVYDRSEDFAVKGEHVVEIRDRRFWLSRQLHMDRRGREPTTDRLYVIGYHYHETRSDPLIVAAHRDLNSHLLLVLGRAEGVWWGYDFFHDPAHRDESPFRVVSLNDEVPPDFDLVYIWEIVGITLPPSTCASASRLTNRVQSYREIRPYIGHFNRLGMNGVASFFDTALIGLFGDDEQYPVFGGSS